MAGKISSRSAPGQAAIRNARLVQTSADENDILPRWNYFLSVVRRAHQEFEQTIEASRIGPAKMELVRQAIPAQTGPRAVAQPCAQVPAESPPLVKKVLAHMKQKGDVRLIGRGRGAHWEVRSASKDLKSTAHVARKKPSYSRH
jgi:CO/xanthine dehydrogenase Mo-binding subunit